MFFVTRNDNLLHGSISCFNVFVCLDHDGLIWFGMRTWVYSWPLLWSLLGFIVNIDSQNEYINDRNVLKLTKRDDELARRIARSHDMVVKVSLLRLKR